MMDTAGAAMDIPHHDAPVSLKKSRTAALEAIEDIVYGSVAGVVGKYIEYPFDTVKVRLQSQPDNQPLRYKGPLDCFRQSIKAEGVFGLYRGISAPLVGAALENSSLFFFERIGRAAVYSSGITPQGQELSLGALWFTGAFSGFFTSYVLTPVELVKCKIQAPARADGSAPPQLRPLAVVRDIYQHNGIKGFWVGQMGTLIRESGGCAAWFGSKETVTKLFYHLNMAGASGGVSYNFLFFPADTIKSRMQTAAIGDATRGRTFWQEGAVVWQQHGLRGLYRGCGITCLRSAPSSAFIFMVFDGLKRQFPMQCKMFFT
uniref:Amino acid transporter arg-13 n=1 Tax=Colletotrichum fructicola (strain Nara gc5) TaxID=1213859 RepID=L2FBB1_COLFN